jgi:site-specific recombinase XerD
MRQALSNRGLQQGFLFVLSNGNPVPRNYFAKQLALALKLCNLSPNVYKGHSFRIGAASHAADQGMLDAQICALGNTAEKRLRMRQPYL